MTDGRAIDLLLLVKKKSLKAK